MRVVAIFGPTASGKTEVAEALADRIDGDLVSADAMQAYRGLPILTNQSARPTRLVGIWPLTHEASVAEYQQLAHEAIDEVLAAGRTPIVVGGTGLYLRAALAGLDLPPAPPPALRAHVDDVYGRIGPERAHSLLAERDPQAAARVHANDRRRVVRALELVELGRSLVPDENRLWTRDTRHPTTIIGLDVPRDELLRRIEARTQSMLERGVEEEARKAATAPISPTARAIHGLAAFAELPRAQAVEEYNRRVGRYAAYQRKWMRRIPGLTTVAADRPAAETAAEILALLAGGATLRPAEREDAEAVFQVQRAASLAGLDHIYPPELYPYPDDAVRERWREALDDDSARVVVAEDGGAIVGVASARAGWIDGLYVVPDAWGTGVAGRLHDEALRLLAADGATTARLWVLEDNGRARRFYERRGWRPDGTERIVPFPPHPLDIGYIEGPVMERWSALGNVYLIGEEVPADIRSAVADADGIVEVVDRGEDWAEVRIWNPDGSLAEMSGNGTRIAARWLSARTGRELVSIRVGPRDVRARIMPRDLVEQDLGEVEVCEPEEIAGLTATRVSVGNPHAVVEGDPAALPRIGPLLETHAAFPDRTNVQVARPTSPNEAIARVWERGVGETASSGTSAVAVAAALGLNPATIRFPGGELLVRFEGRRAFLTGPARRVGPHAWVATRSDVAEARKRGLLAADLDAGDLILARPQDGSAPDAYTVLMYRGYRDRVSWLTEFAAPKGPPWRGYVYALAETAIAQASARGRRSVCVDVYGFGESTRAVLASLGFGPEHEGSRVWRVVLD